MPSRFAEGDEVVQAFATEYFLGADEAIEQARILDDGEIQYLITDGYTCAWRIGCRTENAEW